MGTITEFSLRRLFSSSTLRLSICLDRTGLSDRPLSHEESIRARSNAATVTSKSRMVALLDSSETGATGFSFSARMAGTGTSLLALSRNKQRRVLLLCNLPGKFAVVNVRTSDTLRDKNEFLRPSLKNSQVYFIFHRIPQMNLLTTIKWHWLKLIHCIAYRRTNLVLTLRNCWQIYT